MHQVSDEQVNDVSRRNVFSPRCLTTGLPRDSSIYEENQAFDATAYRQYETVRERLGQLFDGAATQYIRTPFVANRDEVKAEEHADVRNLFLFVDRSD